jgi:hypothetical protein
VKQYVVYNALKTTAPPKFKRKGYVIAGIKAVSPKKLPKKLKNDKTKVKIVWKKDKDNVKNPFQFAQSNPSRDDAKQPDPDDPCIHFFVR